MHLQHFVPCRFLPKGKRESNSIHIGFTIIMCCMLLLLSSCSDQAGASSPGTHTATPTSSLLSPTSQAVSSKTDSNGSTAEEILRSQLAKVQMIMDGMSLDQKLGQLIIVEYLGNSYQGTGLQYMVKQDFVGGFLYQEVNHNFDPPYNIVSNVANLSHQIMNDAQIPLLIGTDQEGGVVNRLYKFHGYLPSAAEMAATGDPRTALMQGTQTGKW